MFGIACQLDYDGEPMERFVRLISALDKLPSTAEARNGQIWEGLPRMGVPFGPVQSSTTAPVGGLASYRDPPTKLRRSCKVCIDSAILSTEVFDDIEGRPVLTNIFDTIHPQTLGPN